MRTIAPSRPVLRTAAVSVVIVLLAALYGLDLFLARLEVKEVRFESQRHYAEGVAALRTGKPRLAIDPLRQAYTLERGDRTYALALAEAQVMDDQHEAARFILDDLLSRDPNNAQANLLMARLSASEGDVTLTDAFYHRAIYGAWDRDADKRRLDARLELAGYLAEHGSEEQLLAEILILQNSAPSSVEMTREIAGFYLKAKSASRAVASYRALIRSAPEDAEGYRGLAEAELLSGNYRVAQSAYASALQRRPTDSSWERRANLTTRLAELDPTPRRLASSERLRRSTEILRMVEAAAVNCFAGASFPADLRALLDRSRKMEGKGQGASSLNDQAEAQLEAAEGIWALHAGRCAAQRAKDELLPRLMAKIGAGT